MLKIKKRKEIQIPEENRMAHIDQSKIRNFCIIAHIDHGKSTLADRIIEKTGLLTEREMQNQVLDNMDLERERGITIKAQCVRTIYKAQDGEEYIFNLIDTPGHVDFNYEVSRSLAACEGAILVVDAAQGIEAQTLANVYLAIDHDLDVMPVINKIDLPSAEPERVVNEIEDVIGIEAQDAPRISAKNGINIDQVLEQIVTKIPAPAGDPEKPLQALIFDSIYDSYKGVIIFCRLFDGVVKRGTSIRMMATGAVAEVVEVGIFGAGRFVPCDELSAGMVGYITASLKNVRDTTVGDTVTDNDNPCAEALPGYKKAQPMVYCGLYPADGAKYPDLRDALEKLQLNDASLSFEPETSIALGFGFRCGFLGLLHLEIIQERLEREFNLDLVTTAPGVVYRVHTTDGKMIELTNPSNLPDPSNIEYMEEPFVSAEIMVTTEYVGAIMQLCQERRGVYQGMEYMEEHGGKVRFGVVGTNFITDWVIAGARQDDRFELVAVYSRKQETADAFAAKHQIPYTFTSLEEMAKSPLIDAVYIASPNFLHAEQSILCMKHGKHVLCEKPFASNAWEVREMIAASAKYDVTLMEAMKPTLTPNFRSVRENLGRLGTIRRYFSCYCQYSSRYDKFKEGVVLNAFRPELSNGAMMDIGIYTVYPMVVLFGRPKKIDASGIVLSSSADGQGAVNFEYEGMNATVLYSKIANSSLPTEIQGEEGNITLDRINIIGEVKYTPRLAAASGRGPSAEAQDISVVTDKDEYYYEVAEFIDLVLSGKRQSGINSHEHSLITLEIIDEVRRQLGIRYPADRY